MAVNNRVLAVPLQKLIYSSVGAAYTLVGVLTQPCFLIRIYNGTGEDVTISYDGTNDHEYLASSGVLELGAQTNAQPNNYIANFPLGFSVYVKGTEGMAGYVYFSGYYSPRSLV